MKVFIAIVTILVFELIFVLAISQGYSIEENPEDQHVRLNANALFRCKFSDFDPDEDLIEWCKNDFCTWGRLSGNQNDKRLQYKSLPKYYIVGDRLNGEWNLLIENVTKRELGEYKCTLTHKASNDFKKIQSTSANLNLMEKPGYIEFDNSLPLEIVYGKSTYFKCIVHRGIPQPIFKWKLVDQDSKFVYLKNSKLSIEKTNNGSNLYISTINIDGTFEFENKSLQCEIEHPLLEIQRNSMINSRSVKIDFKYAPLVSIHIKPSKNLIENKVFTFYCESSAVPSTNISTIKLIADDGRTVKNYKNMKGEIAIKLVREMNGKMIVCESENTLGKTIINQTLNISYQPRFIEGPPKLVTLNDTQKSIELKCIVDSNPPSLITWFNEKKQKIHDGNTLFININETRDYTLSYTQIYGQFSCQSSLQGYRNIQRKTLLVKNGLPSITGKSLYNAEENKDIEIEFSVLSSPDFQVNPMCTKLSINREIKLRQMFAPIGHRLDSYKFDKVYNDENKISSDISFTFKSMSMEDYGVYNCTVDNSYGSNSFVFEIQPKKNDNRFIVALSLSILFSVLFLSLIFIIIIVTFHLKLKEKNKKKKTLKNVYDYSLKNSPNLSVSEWITNNSLTDKHDDKMSQCEIFFDGKTLNTYTGSNMDSILIYPTRQSNQSSLNSDHQLIDVRANESALVEVNSEKTLEFNSNELNKFYQDISISSANYQSPSIMISKFQTNV